MSLTTSVARQQTDPISVGPVSSWTWTGYTTAIASTSAATYLLGCYVYTGANTEAEWEIAVGAAGYEVPVATVRFVQGSVVQGHGSVTLPLAYGPIGSGERVACRARGSTTSANYTGVLTYAVGLTEATDNLSSAALVVVPAGADGAVLLIAGTWTNGPWVSLVTNLKAGSYLAGVAVSPGAWADYEIDLGVGPEGAESVLTTVRDSNLLGSMRVLWLPHLYLLEGVSDVSARVRAVGGSSGDGRIALLYYGDVVNPSIEEEYEPGDSFGPLVWAELENPGSTTTVHAPVDLPDPDTYYHGFKAAELLSAGRIRRALSDEGGQYESQRFTVTLSDQNRRWRTYLGTTTSSRLLLNKRVVVRMISDPGRRALLRPRTVAIGLIRSYELG